MNYIFKIFPILLFVILFITLITCVWNILAPASLTWLGEVEKCIYLALSTAGLIVLLCVADDLNK